MLTNVALKALKPGPKPYKKADGGGLFVLVQPNGTKVWRFAYRFEGKQKLLSGGPFPATTILAARAWRDMMKHQLALGLDPSQERRKARWTILTMVRTQETRFAEWEEFEELDGANPMWRIPAARMKMRSEHLVPLPRQALELLKEINDINLYRKAGNLKLGRYLFPVAYTKSRVISENRMLDIMYRIGLRGKATVHGFRGLARAFIPRSRAALSPS